MTRCYRFIGPDGAVGSCMFRTSRGAMPAAEVRKRIAEVLATMERLGLRAIARISRKERALLEGRQR